MSASIAIRIENIDLTEKRSPLSPEQVAELINKHRVKVIVEPWDRHFADEQFLKAGAVISKNRVIRHLVAAWKNMINIFD